MSVFLRVTTELVVQQNEESLVVALFGPTSPLSLRPAEEVVCLHLVLEDALDTGLERAIEKLHIERCAINLC